ncbi:hypothetical protein QYE77_09060 [Thermanaerothrix sp. 4228-RoL]|uniref:Uncharacterized protein n=1 Tax=Thermanaerothrix solaris TaxID=3058434 RepID=A0ABU3NNK2_9CHLR|nr:hypothetical protein [Thermanaerothrix sp. 4228-RoL]MDT8898415.1 hypothetical protein [Thermanaerothrix sp. 4228-RoL]
MRPRLRWLYPLLIALVLAAVTFAYAAANTVPPSSAGDGSNAISGYTVSNVHYVLDSTNPAVISAVEFTLSGSNPAQTVKVQLTASGAWYTCTLSGSTYSCNVGGGVSVYDASILRVVAAQ